MRNRWFVVLLPLVVLSLSGWFWNNNKEEGPVVTGIWKSINLTEAMNLNFSSDGTYQAEVADKQTLKIAGDYRLLGDQIIFDNDTAASHSVCNDRAYYYFKISEGKLRLTLIADSCEPRRSILGGYWQLVSNPAMDKKKK